MKNDSNRRLLTRTECEHILNALNNIQYKLFAIVYIIAILLFGLIGFLSAYISGEYINGLLNFLIPTLGIGLFILYEIIVTRYVKKKINANTMYVREAIYHYKATRYNSVYLSGYKHSSIHGYSCLSLREPLSKGNRVIILEHIRWVYKARRNR